jgi:hypothetical protein
VFQDFHLLLQNDPRWEGETFQFSPTSPRMERMDRLELPGAPPGLPKYNRLSNSSSFSRSSSFRGQQLDRQPDAACQMPRYDDQVQLKLPPKYAELFNFTGEDESLGTPPLYYSHSTSEEEIEDGGEIDTAEETNKKTQNKKLIMTAVETKNEIKSVGHDNFINIEKNNKNKPVNGSILKKPNVNVKLEKEKESNAKNKNEKSFPLVKEQTPAKSNPKLIGASKNEPKTTKESAPAKNNSKLKSEVGNETKSTPEKNPPQSYIKPKKGDIKVAAKANLNKTTNTNNGNKNIIKQEKEVVAENVPNKPTKSYSKITKPKPDTSVS